jgi:uncharacterized SAM-binding protein YcdF (DUF218 family)
MEIVHRHMLVVIALLFTLGLIVFAMLHWGGYLLVHSDALPSHADGIVVLDAGAGASEDARITGAIHLLNQGIVNQALLSLPKQGFWGQSIPGVARTYLEKKYGSEIASHIGFCETDSNVNSTEEEAQAVMRCVQDEHWNSVIIVTSDFHSRRAGIIWHRTCKREHAAIQISVEGVPDPLFRPTGWWTNRLYAKTWLLEFTKLVWSTVF